MSGLEHFFNVHTHHNYGAELFILQLDSVNPTISNAFFSIGIHPEQAKIDTTFNSGFISLLQNERCLAIGEIGLDSRYQNTEAQELCYVSQLKLAKEFSKPIILHCVNQWDRCRFLHQKHASGTPIIYHGFNKSGILKSVLEYNDVWISIGANILSNEKLQRVIEEIPTSRLLVETDMSEVPIQEVYQKLADLKSLSLREFSKQIFTNVQGIFKL